MNTRPVLKKVRNYFILEQFDLLWKIKSNILLCFLENGDYLCFNAVMYKYETDTLYKRKDGI